MSTINMNSKPSGRWPSVNAKFSNIRVNFFVHFFTYPCHEPFLARLTIGNDRAHFYARLKLSGLLMVCDACMANVHKPALVVSQTLNFGRTAICNRVPRTGATSTHRSKAASRWSQQME